MSASLLDPPQGDSHTFAPDDAQERSVEGTEGVLNDVGTVGDQLGRTMHALQRARAQLAASGGEGATEWSSRVTLAKIVMTGPKRVSELAELVHVDTSTVSRTVAAMVKDGLLERQADPDDGRASLLVATDRGRAAMTEFRAHRNRELARVLHTWSADDLRVFASYLDRFAEDLGEHTTRATARESATSSHRGARSEGDQTS